MQIELIQRVVIDLTASQHDPCTLERMRTTKTYDEPHIALDLHNKPVV